MSFSLLGRPIQLTANVPFHPTSASTHKIQRLVHTHGVSALFQLTHIPEPVSPNPFPNCPYTYPPLLHLLSRYDHLFQEPSNVPPPRPISHHIHLHPDSQPVNIRPYRYPHSQKVELERQIANMLQTGFIQLSHNPFSSPVLLVKKKDDS